MQTDVLIKLSPQMYKLLARCHQWDPNSNGKKNILTLLALPKDLDLLPSGLQTCQAFAAYVMVLIPRAYVRCFMRNKMAPSGVRSISAAQLKGVEWPCGAGGSHGAARLTLRALFLLSC